ncbi:MAG: hypothetical protein LC723_04145 [Actinobacteria bacterium]|nr:hypothetical protein [Actinomycetota bacterium]
MDSSGANEADLATALKAITTFGEDVELRSRIASLESAFTSTSLENVQTRLEGASINEALTQAALTVKAAAGQINVVMHAVGILISLPYVLQPGEEVISLNLGAGNTGRDYDLETNRQVAEFKFIRWRGGAESIRQNSIFKDLVALLADESGRVRRLYVTGKEHPLRFLNNRRALSSVLSKDRATAERFQQRYGTRYSVVSEFWSDLQHEIEIVDLEELVPSLRFLDP